MPLLTRKRQHAIKQEAAEGTAETLAAADVKMAVEDLEGNYTPELQERRPLRADLSPTASVVGIEMGEITGRTELKPGLTATDDPNFHLTLLAMGMQQHTARELTMAGAATGTFIAGEYITGDTAGTGYFLRIDGLKLMFVEVVAFIASEVITGATSGATLTVHATPVFTDLGKAYRPDSVSPPSFTQAVMADGIKKEIFGSRGDGSIEVGGTGQLGFLNFTMNGAMVKPIDQALFSPVTIPLIVPETFVGASVKVGETELCVDSFTMNFGNTVARRACSNATTGIKSYRITDRRPTIVIDPEQELEATIDFFTKLAGGTLFGFYAQIGSSAGKRTIIVSSRAQYQEMPSADRDGIATYTPTLLLTRGGTPGDDEFILAFV